MPAATRERYFTGRPCKRGHIAERTVEDCICTECRREDSRARHSKDPQAARDRVAAWRLANPEKARAKGRATQRRRKMAAVQRMPAWADLASIEFFYECCPSGCHVDHVLPLRGKTVSGLHVAENLQWLPALENQRKGNRV